METPAENTAAVKAAPVIIARRCAVLTIEHTDLLLPDSMTSSQREQLLNMLESCLLMAYTCDCNDLVYRVTGPVSTELRISTRKFNVSEEDAK